MKKIGKALKAAMQKKEMMMAEEKMEKMPKGKSLKVKETKSMKKY
jgi:hypothetical protein